MYLLNFRSFLLNLDYFIALLYLSLLISNVKFSSKLRTDPSASTEVSDETFVDFMKRIL